MKPVTRALLQIKNEFNKNELVQIIELPAHKLDLKTISKYAKENGISYNGVKFHRNHINIGGVNFVANGIDKNNLPF